MEKTLIKIVIANPEGVAISFLKNVGILRSFFDEIVEPVPSLFYKIASSLRSSQ